MKKAVYQLSSNSFEKILTAQFIIDVGWEIETKLFFQNFENIENILLNFR